MANKFVGVLFLLVAAGFAVFFGAVIFGDGWNEGAYRLRHAKPAQVWQLIGFFAFGIAGVVLLLKRRGR